MKIRTKADISGSDALQMPVQYACMLLMQHEEAMDHIVEYLR